MTSNFPYLNAALYLRENHHVQVKDKDRCLSDLFKNEPIPEGALVADIGCATGALLAHLGKEFPLWRFYGLDPDELLVSEARLRVPAAHFTVGSALQLPSIWAELFDISISSGVLGIFDEEEARLALEEMLRVTRPGGLICVLANFNPAPADVWIKHRKINVDGPSQWESGWNIFSERTVATWLEGRVDQLRFVPFEISVDVPRQEDPSRTYTFMDMYGRRKIANGLCILAELQYLIARKSG